ncbi:MAG: DUF1579 family protein [Thermoanaerobaculia bacterium]|nr:DUF1579 family protein [Thermoanaerobaculia bacterium]
MREMALRTLAWSIVCVLVMVPSAWAEGSLDEVLARHMEARGGEDAWSAVHNVRATGTYDSFSKKGPFTRLQTQDGKLYMEYHLGNRPVTKAHNGEFAWWVNPMREPGPKKIDGADLPVVERERDFPNALFAADRYETTLVGPAEFEGMEVLQIDIKRADGSEESWYLDPDSFLEVALESPGSDFGRPMVQRTFFDDFRKVGDVMIPHYIESQWYTRLRVQHVDSMELNVDVEPSLFTMPPPPGMEPWVALAGNWKVVVERTPGPGAEPTQSERTSEIELALGDTLLQERYESDGEGVLVSLTFDRFQNVYRRTAIDSGRGLLDVQIGTQQEDGSIILDNLETGTFIMGGPRKVNLRTTYSDLSSEGFVAVVEGSFDGGESWFEASRSTYQRAD